MVKKADIKRYPLNMRTTKEVREKLDRAASTSGRSLAQEVEFRLERSFERETLMAETRKAVETVWRDDLHNIFKRELSKAFKTRYEMHKAVVGEFLAQWENIGHDEPPSRSSSGPQIKARYETAKALVGEFLAQREDIGHDERPSRSRSGPQIKASAHEPTPRSKAKS